ncbi:hypothetical protein D3C87_903480 [compost metagenome]
MLRRQGLQRPRPGDFQRTPPRRIGHQRAHAVDQLVLRAPFDRVAQHGRNLGMRIQLRHHGLAMPQQDRQARQLHRAGVVGLAHVQPDLGARQQGVALRRRPGGAEGVGHPQSGGSQCLQHLQPPRRRLTEEDDVDVLLCVVQHFGLRQQRRGQRLEARPHVIRPMDAQRRVVHHVLEAVLPHVGALQQPLVAGHLREQRGQGRLEVDDDRVRRQLVVRGQAQAHREKEEIDVVVVDTRPRRNACGVAEAFAGEAKALHHLPHVLVAQRAEAQVRPVRKVRRPALRAAAFTHKRPSSTAWQATCTPFRLSSCGRSVEQRAFACGQRG